MKRVVITGMGITSCIGNNTDEVLHSLIHGKSGISFNEKYKEMGMRSHVSGQVNIDIDAHIPRQTKRFMGNAAAYAYISMQQAIESAKLSLSDISNPRIGLIAGSGGSSTENIVESADILRQKGIKRVGPYRVTRAMSSTVSACLATPFKIKGTNYSISSACATSAHCISAAMEQIILGKQDIVFAGGGEEEHWTLSLLFDAMGALSSKFNNTPKLASRPYDKDRDGFVIAGGGGMLVVEELEHALARKAPILAEIVGYCATSDGESMVAPSGDGAIACMRGALKTTTGKIDYINTHGTSTGVGDIAEAKAIQTVFANQQQPAISSTKSLTGHSLGATGVQEIIYTILMMQNNFIAASANINEIDHKITQTGVDIAHTRRDHEINMAMSNSFGFGGTNSTLILKKYS